MTDQQLPPARRRTVPDLPDPMAPTTPHRDPGPTTAQISRSVPVPVGHALAPGVESTVQISVRTSTQVRAMLDALAADDAHRDNRRVNQRATLDQIITSAYQARFDPAATRT